MPTDIPYLDIHTHTRRADAVCVVSYGLGRDNVPTLPGRPFSAGIHPWDAAGVDTFTLKSYLEKIGSLRPDAIGETGLDYIKGGDRKRQEEVFLAQLDLASGLNKPVIIHCVKAYNELFAIIKQYTQVNFILHGYTGSARQTEQALELGCYISIGPRALASPKTVESIYMIPTSQIFAETDESDISIAYVYDGIAKIKNLQLPVLKEKIMNNFNKIFSTTDDL